MQIEKLVSAINSTLLVEIHEEPGESDESDDETMDDENADDETLDDMGLSSKSTNFDSALNNVNCKL